MDARTLDAITRIVAYNWDDEQYDYLTHPDDGDAHIFTDLKAVREWLEQGYGRYVTQIMTFTATQESAEH